MNYRQPMDIPPFYCPFPFQDPHPGIQRVNDASIAWLSSYVLPEVGPGLIDLWGRQGVAAVGAWMMPDVDEDHLRIYGDWLHFTLIDDGIDGSGGLEAGELAALACQLVRVAECPRADILPHYGWAGALRDIILRLKDMGVANYQLTRLVEDLRAYILAALWEADCRQKRKMPTLDEYALMRLWAGGMLTYAWFYPPVGAYELSWEEYASPIFRAITEMAVSVSSWDNDLLSHFKDVAHDDFRINLIEVCAHASRTSIQEGMVAAIALRDRLLNRYLRLTQQVVQRGASEGMCRYIAGMNSMIRGNIDASVRTIRYLNPYDKDAGQVPWVSLPIETTPVASDDSTEPPPLPSVTWWWNVDMDHAPTPLST